MNNFKTIRRSTKIYQSPQVGHGASANMLPLITELVGISLSEGPSMIRRARLHSVESQVSNRTHRPRVGPVCGGWTPRGSAEPALGMVVFWEVGWSPVRPPCLCIYILHPSVQARAAENIFRAAPWGMRDCARALQSTAVTECACGANGTGLIEAASDSTLFT